MGILSTGVLRVFKIGSHERPASPSDIEDFEKRLKECYESHEKNFVCKHDVQIETIGLDTVNALFQLYDRKLISAQVLMEKLGISGN